MLRCITFMLLCHRLAAFSPRSLRISLWVMASSFHKVVGSIQRQYLHEPLFPAIIRNDRHCRRCRALCTEQTNDTAPRTRRKFLRAIFTIQQLLRRLLIYQQRPYRILPRTLPLSTTSKLSSHPYLLPRDQRHA